MILINGYGKMGKLLREAAPDAVVVDPKGVEGGYRSLLEVPARPDVCVDFSYHDACFALCDYAVREGIPMVVATTGHTPEEKACLAQAAHSIPVFVAQNLSMCVYALSRAAVAVAGQMQAPLVQVHEVHRLGKKDAPGGTALALAHELCEACHKRGVLDGVSTDPDWVGLSYERIGDTVGVHRILLCDGVQRVELCHAALDRALFVRGALAACAFVRQCPCGLYGMQDLYRYEI